MIYQEIRRSRHTLPRWQYWLMRLQWWRWRQILPGVLVRR